MAARPPQLNRSRPLSRRLGMYFVGVAIGLVLVGFLLSMRTLMGTGQGQGSPGPGPAAQP